jgi:acyl carrier protein
MKNAGLVDIFVGIAKSKFGKQVCLERSIFENGLSSLEILILVTEFEKKTGLSISIEELYQAGSFIRYLKQVEIEHD